MFRPSIDWRRYKKTAVEIDFKEDPEIASAISDAIKIIPRQPAQSATSLKDFARQIILLMRKKTIIAERLEAGKLQITITTNDIQNDFWIEVKLFEVNDRPLGVAIPD